MGGNRQGQEKVTLDTVDFHSFKALNDHFEVQFFQGFIFRPYQRHLEHGVLCSSHFFLKLRSLLACGFNGIYGIHRWQ